MKFKIDSNPCISNTDTIYSQMLLNMFSSQYVYKSVPWKFYINKLRVNSGGFCIAQGWCVDRNNAVDQMVKEQEKSIYFPCIVFL